MKYSSHATTYAYSSTFSILSQCTFSKTNTQMEVSLARGLQTIRRYPKSIDEVGLPSARLLLIEKFIIHRYYFRKGAGGGEEMFGSRRSRR